MANLHEARTLVDLLSLRARQDPQGIWFTLYGEAVTYQTVQEQSLRYAATLAQSGFGRGDAVALVLPTCQEFFYSFFGALALGAVPVPLYPTLGVEPLGNLFRASEVRAVITIDWLRKTVEEARKESPALEVILTPEELEAPASGPLLPMISEDDVAFIQYTSGSTGAPRWVVLSHRNVLANVRAMVSRAEIRARETVVSWLPLYHDMGLIGCAFGSLYCGARLILLPPDLRNVRAWLEAITAARAAFTASPDFGYRLSVRNVHDLTGLDLSGLRIALSGAEPVRLSTSQAFEAKLGLKNVVCPAYGLAEATLAVTMGTPGEPVRVDPSGRYVSSGKAIPGVEVRVVSEGEPVAPGTAGEIMVSGPGIMQGYHNDPAATAQIFRDGWLHTGELGFLDDEGYLLVTGRIKDLIIVRGENISPADIEEIVDQVPGMRYSAAIGVENERLVTEQLVVIAEVQDETLEREACSRLIREIARRLREERGLRPSRVLLVRPHTIPKTSSGKIQHQRLTDLLESGALLASVLGRSRLARKLGAES